MDEGLLVTADEESLATSCDSFSNIDDEPKGLGKSFVTLGQAGARLYIVDGNTNMRPRSNAASARERLKFRH